MSQLTVSLEPVPLRIEPFFDLKCRLYHCRPILDRIGDPDVGTVFRCRLSRPNCMVWSGSHGFPMLQPRQRRQGFRRISSGASQPRRPIESLPDHICKQEVQRAASNALFLQHINCIASCHTERQYSTKASASAARMCRAFVVCDRQSTQGECLLTSTLSFPSANRRVIGTRAAVRLRQTAGTNFPRQIF